MTQASRPIDLDRFIPEAYKDRSTNVIGKVVGLLEDFVNGEVDENFDFAKDVEDIYLYWDTLKKDYKWKVKELLDPYGISDLIVNDDEQLGRFLHLLGSLYSSKGTSHMLSNILRLVGMDARLVRWYEEEYLEWRPVKEHCKSIMVISVGDNAITEEMIEYFNKLAEVLLDICTTIASWVFVKNLTDDVSTLDEAVQIFINTGHYDSYVSCAFELNNRYNYTPYDYNDAYKFEIEPPRFLSIDDVTRYICSICDYIYDPIEEARKPFKELPPSYLCPICGSFKTDFNAFEFDPSGGVDSIKFILASMKENNNFESLFNLANSISDFSIYDSYPKFQELLINAVDASTHSFKDDIINQTFSSELLTSMYSIFSGIKSDNFDALEKIGMSINPAAIDKYSRGYINSPYILHGLSYNKINYIIHNSEPDCVRLHNSKFYHAIPPGLMVDAYLGQEFFDIHVHDPVLRYSTNCDPIINHNYSYRRNERFDLHIDPRRRCSARPCLTDNGAYPYPRHLGKKEVFSNYGSFFYGFIDGTYSQDLNNSFSNVTTDTDTDILILKIKDTLMSMLNYTAMNQFIGSLDSFMIYTEDSIFLNNITNISETNLTENQMLEFTNTLNYIEYIKTI